MATVSTVTPRPTSDSNKSNECHCPRCGAKLGGSVVRVRWTGISVAMTLFFKIYWRGPLL